MAKVVRGRKLTNDEVEDIVNGLWRNDDEVIIAVCAVDGWEKIGRVKDLLDDYDVDLFDMEQTFYDLEVVQ